jgi:hypothetical protein
VKISQREARRLKKRCNQLQAQITNMTARWSRAYYDGGVKLCGDVPAGDDVVASIRTSIALGHVVVVRESSQLGKLDFYADRSMSSD